MKNNEDFAFAWRNLYNIVLDPRLILKTQNLKPHQNPQNQKHPSMTNSIKRGDLQKKKSHNTNVYTKDKQPSGIVKGMQKEIYYRQLKEKNTKN